MWGQNEKSRGKKREKNEAGGWALGGFEMFLNA